MCLFSFFSNNLTLTTVNSGGIRTRIVRWKESMLTTRSLIEHSTLGARIGVTNPSGPSPQPTACWSLSAFNGELNVVMQCDQIG